MPRLRPAPRLVREAAEYRADIARLRPGCCAVCGEAGSATAPLLALAPRHDPSVHVELHASCQAAWHRKRGASPVTEPPPKGDAWEDIVCAVIVPQRCFPDQLDNAAPRKGLPVYGLPTSPKVDPDGEPLVAYECVAADGRVLGMEWLPRDVTIRVPPDDAA